MLWPGSWETYLGKCSVVGAVIFTAAAAQAQTNSTAATSSTKPTSAQTVTAQGGSSQTKSKTATAHRTSAKSKSRRSRKTSSRKHGQQKIDAERAREIQEALIREHYLSGDATGVWNDATQKAMQHYQADNGWQTKTTPDARALIKLGLGPDRQHLLNPESAMTVDSPAAHAGANATNHVAPAATAANAGKPASAAVPASTDDPAKSKPQQ